MAFISASLRAGVRGAIKPHDRSRPITALHFLSHGTASGPLGAIEERPYVKAMVRAGDCMKALEHVLLMQHVAC